MIFPANSLEIKGDRTMKNLIVVMFFTLLLVGCGSDVKKADTSRPDATLPDAEGWYSLFDGETLSGWKASDSQGTFTVRDGMIISNGERSHLYYIGAVNGADFVNFEIKVDVMTEPGANSGIYFHTKYQMEGWPLKGYEAQINNTSKDLKRTSSLFGIIDVLESPAKDNEWFTQHIIVQGKRIIIKTNDNVIVDYTEPDESPSYEDWPGRKISSGTFALQGHDPKSIVYFKNIKVKPLP